MPFFTCFWVGQRPPKAAGNPFTNAPWRLQIPLTGGLLRQNMHAVRLFPALFFLIIVLSACGPGNEIRLLAVAPPAVSVLPKPNAPKVTVVEFKDEREDSSTIGQRRDFSAFTCSDSPTLWVSHALADELTKHGLQVSYATSVEQARKGNPDYIVWGTLKKVWLKESSATNLETSLEAVVNRAVFRAENRIRRGIILLWHNEDFKP